MPLLRLGALLLPWTPGLIYKLSSIPSVFFLSQMTRLSRTARTVLTQAVRNAPKQTAEQRLHMLSTFSIDEAKLRKMSQPVLLIGSCNDHLLPSVQEVNHLATIFPNSQVIILPHSGHACLIESDIDLPKILKQSNFGR